jgi:hypothetical protein
MKKLIPTQNARTVAAVKDTEYVVLSDGTVARRLKPVVINDRKYFNLIIDGKYTRIPALRLKEMAKSL